MASLLSIQPGEIIDEESLISSLSEQETLSWLLSLDAVLILGGGVPLAPKEPPTYVQRRCDVVAKLFNRIDNRKEGSTLPNILCLSAGTAHLPQYILPNDGLREFHIIILLFPESIDQSLTSYSFMGVYIVCSLSDASPKT